ncbi:MAG: branched-chain amino acid ABC transporter permease [Candidatus Rokubacteria bacterium]|nr:branched-chain amino acid ABC transporter permease [Candidatus Rokubacteria bacterium]
MSVSLLVPILFNGISLSAIYILLALGFTLVFGIMRVVNFAHGEFAMMGGFWLLFLLDRVALPYWVALPLAAVLVGVSSLLPERFVFRRLYGQELPSMIAALGLSVAIAEGAVIVFEVHERNIPAAFQGLFQIGGFTFPEDRLVVVAIALAALGAFWLFVRFTRTGLALRTVAQDREIAEAQGIDTRATYRITFFLATMMAGLGGALFAQIYALSPYMGQLPLMKAFIIVIVGGLGSVPGAALGGVLLGMSESFLHTFFGASIAQFASFGAIILLLILRPWGLLGSPEG